MGLFERLFRPKETNPVPESPNTCSAVPDALMEEDQFWRIIKIAKDTANGGYNHQQRELAKELRKLKPNDIILFGNRFRHFRGQANTWELWGAI